LACGLSLGEFTTLVALGAICFEDGLKLVRQRGEAMEAAAKKNPGTMASILGLSVEGCRALCQETGAELANLNSPEQIVISGTVESINKACALAKTKGAKRAIPLKVGGAFHSSLMEPARAGLEAALLNLKIEKPKGVFIPNVTGQAESDPEAIRKLLSKQLTSPVEWVKSMNYAAQSGTKEYLEIGPGKVLKGLARKINPELNVISIEKMGDLEQLKLITADQS
jgi:[acyl-carrier-protein] S-malonyltransferase